MFGVVVGDSGRDGFGFFPEINHQLVNSSLKKKEIKKTKDLKREEICFPNSERIQFVLS